ncbi:MAG TPA: helix-turn-helix transcriptional regulator [Actinocrinis sp.]|nr:helix-turn-helix transcriptional regulator [Actinocrinis sp.]
MGKQDLLKLGTYLRTEREHTGMSQRQVATKAGLDNSYVARLERGDFAASPNPSHIQQLCDALGIDSAEAMSYIGVKSSFPEPRAYFRRAYGVTAEDAEVMAQLIEEFQARKKEGGEK